MIRLGVIGTNWITDQFVQGALESGEYRLSAVYSRALSSAAQFADKYQDGASIQLFDDLDLLAASNDVDAIYIASPNSLHAPQSIQMLAASKHVICEKPIAANADLADQMYQTAKENNVVLFEAFMSCHTPNFKLIKQKLPTLGKLSKAFITYCQYSSRYDKYLAGENPNTFNPQFANGSIMDIGYYCLASAVSLFGKPKTVNAVGQLLESGVDGNGSVILGYDTFEVVLQHSKTSNSYLPSEIQGEAGALLIDMISIAEKVTHVRKGEQPEDISQPQFENRMRYEAEAFAEQVKTNTMDKECMERSLLVAQLLTEIRRQVGVVFPQDK